MRPWLCDGGMGRCPHWGHTEDRDGPPRGVAEGTGPISVSWTAGLLGRAITVADEYYLEIAVK